ncbi:TPA: DUF4238 domain-containing protein [Salmonella enterica]|uniref:DUF4238 domain-containing protein n=1 Tax=Salmonella enterica TaxID=28901 RepID=A0A748RIA7_SALER|nr:DUF4238 domain-containing protein [Salmonella enterica]HAF4932904.1 DUF4238 domain-containing protein [Salmonella enterica]HAF5250204.1 DUF4238 domain-containing protein [Salmonella enterica]HAF5747338.1 DUF4238 domain-containing protein [Salmonella enterica]HAG3489360.1 DUF4238 domain-containing protein [Salmonella enterica]
MKIFEKKTKHHYVWAHYLRDWTIDGTNIWYITKKSNIACDSVRGLGFEKNFYKMGELKESDKELITLIINKSNETLKEIHWDFVNMIFKTQKIISLLSPSVKEKSGLNPEEIMQSNLFENYLSQQESRAIEILSELKKGNLLCLEDKETYYDFCYFLGYQFSRTLKMKKLLILTLDKIPGQIKVRERLKDFYERNWWFMCSLMATNLSYDMSLNTERKLILLENESSIDFLTSDQPLININPEGSEGESVDYYYPLSGRKALLILTSGESYFSSNLLNDDAVHMLNSKIANASCKTIFGKNREDIKMYSKEFNQRKYLEFVGNLTD